MRSNREWLLLRSSHPNVAFESTRLIMSVKNEMIPHRPFFSLSFISLPVDGTLIKKKIKFSSYNGIQSAAVAKSNMT